jgi:hypothetical protein
MGKKKSKKFDQAAMVNFSNGVSLGIEVGKAELAKDVSRVLDVVGLLTNFGLHRYGVALLDELREELSEFAAFPDASECDGCDCESEGCGDE